MTLGLGSEIRTVKDWFAVQVIRSPDPRSTQASWPSDRVILRPNPSSGRPDRIPRFASTAVTR